MINNELAIGHLRSQFTKSNETYQQSSTSSTMSSLTSTHLCHVSLNLQRSSRKRDFGQIGFPDIQKSKHRCLEFRNRSPQEDNNGDGTISANTCAPTVRMASDGNTKQNDMVLSKADSLPKMLVDSSNVGTFRREIRIKLLEIVDQTGEMDEDRVITDGEFESRCTLEIFLAEYENEGGRMKLKRGEDVWRSQQMCLIRTTRDDFGHSTSQLVALTPFIVPAEDLLVKKMSKEKSISSNENPTFSLSDQYIIQVWFEAPSPKHRWPPLDLQSALDPNGRMMTWLRQGTFTGTDMRLMFKGTLFVEEEACNSLKLALKLGDVRIRTNYALRLDIKYSIPPQSRTPLKIPQSHVIEPVNKKESTAEPRNPLSTFRTSLTLDSKAICVALKENESSNVNKQTHVQPPPLLVPRTKRRLCGDVVKNVLIEGEELGVINDEFETDWQATSHFEMIKELPGIGSMTKEYIMKWDRYTRPLKLSCNFYLSQVLLRFVKENIPWFERDSRRVREFSLHATSLRLRASIGIECFAECIGLLRNCITSQIDAKDPQPTDYLTPDHLPDDDIYTRDVMNTTKNSELSINQKKEIGNLIPNQTADAGKVEKKALRSNALSTKSLNKEVADKNNLLKELTNKNIKPDEQIRLETKEDQKWAEVDDKFEDASEDTNILEIDDYFDAEDGSDTLEKQFYFNSCWQSIIKRWPRLKLHGSYSFGVASMLAAMAIFQGFPNDNIDRLIALYIHYCPNEDIKNLVAMYYNAPEIVPEVQSVCMTELKLHRIMWEASRETCEYWLTDVYRLESGTRRTVRDAIETGTNARAWDELWKCISEGPR